MSTTDEPVTDHDTPTVSAEVRTLTVVISNTYTCGRESGGMAQVRYPEPGEPLIEWWGEHMRLTGDGHPCGATEHAEYEMEIVDAPDAPHLVGETWLAEG